MVYVPRFWRGRDIVGTRVGVLQSSFGGRSLQLHKMSSWTMSFLVLSYLWEVQGSEVEVGRQKLEASEDYSLLLYCGRLQSLLVPSWVQKIDVYFFFLTSCWDWVPPKLHKVALVICQSHLTPMFQIQPSMQYIWTFVLKECYDWCSYLAIWPPNWFFLNIHLFIH